LLAARMVAARAVAIHKNLKDMGAGQCLLESAQEAKEAVRSLCSDLATTVCTVRGGGVVPLHKPTKEGICGECGANLKEQIQTEDVLK
jgi:tRNA(Met) C34 N-acetyltransferase TmcA